MVRTRTEDAFCSLAVQGFRVTVNAGLVSPRVTAARMRLEVGLMDRRIEIAQAEDFLV